MSARFWRRLYNPLLLFLESRERNKVYNGIFAAFECGVHGRRVLLFLLERQKKIDNIRLVYYNYFYWRNTQEAEEAPLLRV